LKLPTIIKLYDYSNVFSHQLSVNT